MQRQKRIPVRKRIDEQKVDGKCKTFRTVCKEMKNIDKKKFF